MSRKQKLQKIAALSKGQNNNVTFLSRLSDGRLFDGSGFVDEPEGFCVIRPLEPNVDFEIFSSLHDKKSHASYVLEAFIDEINKIADRRDADGKIISITRRIIR